MIGGDALQAADCDGFGFDATASTRGLAGTIAHAAKNAGKDVRFTVDQVGFRELSVCDEPDVFGYVGVCGARPLAIDDAMKVIGISGIGRFHRYLAPCRLRRSVLKTTLACMIDQKGKRIPMKTNPLQSGRERTFDYSTRTLNRTSKLPPAAMAPCGRTLI